MSSKTLSNGTLSLRFMQNAARAKQLETAELEQAKIKDEAEWEVPASMRDAWGPQPSAVAGPVTSYINFMFEDHEEGSSSAPPTGTQWRGRRAFDGKGKEIDLRQTDVPEAQPQERVTDVDRVKGKTRLTAISGSSGSATDSKKPKTSSVTKKGSASTKPRPDLDLLSNTGVDIRSKRRATGSTIPVDSEGTHQAPPSVPLPPASTVQTDFKKSGANIATGRGFMKPEGVDAPSISSKRPAERVAESDGKKKKKKRTSDLSVHDDN